MFFYDLMISLVEAAGDRMLLNLDLNRDGQVNPEVGLSVRCFKQLKSSIFFFFF